MPLSRIPGIVSGWKQVCPVYAFDNVYVVPFALSNKKEKHVLYKGVSSARMHKWTHKDPTFSRVHDEIHVFLCPAG
jgi:hypothetical protein